MTATLSESHLPVAPLAGRDGALLSVIIQVAARRLEEILEALGELPYHINPDISYHQGDGSEAIVEFPAYESWVSGVRRVVGSRAAVRVQR